MQEALGDTFAVPLKSLGSGSDLTLPSSSEADTLERHDLALLAGSAPTLTRDEILERRRKHYGPNLALFFPEDPLHVTSAVGCRLYTSDSREEADSYLDCINNVSHVGHCHPQVTAAIAGQLARVNTNSRYLSQEHVQYAEALTATFPAPLETLYLLSSGSEANELALRVARTLRCDGAPRTAPLHVAVLDHAYHGHTNAAMELSPYKFYGPGGAGRAQHVHVLPCPDTYRGTGLGGEAAARAAVAEAAAAGATIGAFFAESVISCGGQVMFPDGYLAGVYRVMREQGALCVADEVQCGFGRVGDAFWAFQLQGVVPDIVTIGKPMGNGYPVSGAVMSRALAGAFAAAGGEFFATHGGSNAAVAAGAATLRVLREEGLQARAAAVGAHVAAGMRALQAAHPTLVGDVRGRGLMLGMELVTDAATRAPAPALAAALRARCAARHRVLLSAEGPWGSVIKFKPPMCFGEREADRMLRALGCELAALAADHEQLQALHDASRAAVAQLTRAREAWD
uniref:Ethanolamine-phosphate phospho-lyase n=1 Tax=Auxenochlorella protothecoides TaxID=3075 RepID=A0A1D1ZS12_AUXPR